MPNSKLATYNAHCRNRNPRRMKIDRITPHYMAGNMGAKQCADYFARSGRSASCNYCIGSDGAIAVCVDEDFRAWTSSNEGNDTRAVTFECANLDANGTLSNACYNSLIALCADICKRHGINPHFDGSPNGSITMHKQFAATSCPGNWLTQKITSGQFERDIKAKMNGSKPKEPYKPITKEKDGSIYRLYNKGNGDHLLTTSYNEAESAHKAGWIYEGVAWVAPKDGAPVFRLYNNGKHLYTTDLRERDVLVTRGWKNEGVAFKSSGSKSVYRMFNSKTGTHVFTADRKEHDALTKAGWICEGQPIKY